MINLFYRSASVTVSFPSLSRTQHIKTNNNYVFKKMFVPNKIILIFFYENDKKNSFHCFAVYLLLPNS